MAGDNLVTPEQARAILKKDFANIIRKSREGKTLSAQERALLQSIASGSRDEPDDRAKAQNLSELCEILGVSRPTLAKWRKMKGAPRPGSDSTWSVLEWRVFMQERDLKGYRGQRGPGADVIGDDQLKARKLLVEIETKEQKLAVLRGESIPIEKVREFYGKRVSETISILRNRLENELPPLLTGRSAVEIREECSRVVDEIVEAFHREPL